MWAHEYACKDYKCVCNFLKPFSFVWFFSELKKRIQSFLDDGDEDALPDLFEAMMIRKLSGKHDESDDEVMEEVRKYPINDAHKKVDDIASDDENDGHGDSSDSDIESDDDTNDGDLSDSAKSDHSSDSDSESD